MFDRRPRFPNGSAWLALAALVLPALDVRAAEPPAGEAAIPIENLGPAPQVPDPLDRRVITATTVTALVGNRGGPAGALIVWKGGQIGAWVESGPTRRRMPAAIDRDQLIGIEQDKPVGYANNPEEKKAYNFVLLHARDVPLEDLRKGANREVTRVHLMEQSERYKGELVRVSGIVRRVVKYDAPKALWNDGIKDLYEIWLYHPPGNEFFCVVVSSLPEGVPTGEEVEFEAECEAYFFKRYLYRAPNPNGVAPLWRKVPLLLGNSIRVPAAPPSGTRFLTDSFIPSILAGIVGVVALGAGLTIWFRRGDRRVQDRLLRMRQMPPSFSEPPAEEGAPGAVG
jgi:hypothetical protein